MITYSEVELLNLKITHFKILIGTNKLPFKISVPNYTLTINV